MTTLFWRWIAQSAVREGRWKYLRGGTREYLFDLDADCEEQHNLLATHPEIAQRLKARLAEWSQELNPPGLETQKMSTTWEQYFDHYLDGKPAPRPDAARRADAAGKADVFQGWIARNGTLAVREGCLQVTPEPSARQAPFLACARLSLPGPVKATLNLRSATGGSVGFAWRIDGQRDFVPGQRVAVPVNGSDQWQDVQVEIPAEGKIIHLRLLLPQGESAIRHISLTSETGDAVKAWRF